MSISAAEIIFDFNLHVFMFKCVYTQIENRLKLKN
jgi:hypothetical protein